VQRGKLTNGGQQLTVELVKGTQYAYVLFPPVNYQTISQDFVSQLKALSDKQALKGLILDLRIASSSGGFPLQDLLTLFYNGKIGELYNRAKQVQPLNITGQDQLGSQKIPLVILVGPQTNGGPEILAAALQAGKRATVVGANTPGQVESADAFLLPDGSRIYIATTSFKLSDGTDLGVNGMQPNVVVDAAWDQIQSNADPVLNKALQILDGQK
jgi:carboxyl-terminal processing protease